MTTIDPSVLAHVTGGAGLDPSYPLKLRDRALQQCGPQLDAFSQARKTLAQDPTNARAELDAAAKGRSLALCATNAGFDPPPSWRYASPNGK